MKTIQVLLIIIGVIACGQDNPRTSSFRSPLLHGTSELGDSSKKLMFEYEDLMQSKNFISPVPREQIEYEITYHSAQMKSFNYLLPDSNTNIQCSFKFTKSTVKETLIDLDAMKLSLETVPSQLEWAGTGTDFVQKTCSDQAVAKLTKLEARTVNLKETGLAHLKEIKKDLFDVQEACKRREDLRFGVCDRLRFQVELRSYVTTHQSTPVQTYKYSATVNSKDKTYSFTRMFTLDRPYFSIGGFLDMETATGLKSNLKEKTPQKILVLTWGLATQNEIDELLTKLNK